MPTRDRVIRFPAFTDAAGPYLLDTLKSVSFIEKDAKRFPDTGGWGICAISYMTQHRIRSSLTAAITLSERKFVTSATRL